jgi:hypothetical protein
VTRERRGFPTIIICVIVSAIAVNVLADVSSSTKAMACCAKANGECAKLRAPDDCCRKMGHVSGETAVATVSTAASHVAIPTALDRPVVLDLAACAPPNSAALTRPHDSPHLHQYNPLI